MFFATGYAGMRSFAVSASKRTIVSSSARRGGPSHRAKVVVVGSGRMGHIRSSLVYANPRFELCGIVDTNFDAAASMADTFGVRHSR